MPNPDCQPTTITQTVYGCLDGDLLSKVQRLFNCTLGQNTWQEWHDESQWVDTGDDC